MSTSSARDLLSRVALSIRGRKDWQHAIAFQPDVIRDVLTRGSIDGMESIANALSDTTRDPVNHVILKPTQVICLAESLDATQRTRKDAAEDAELS